VELQISDLIFQRKGQGGGDAEMCEKSEGWRKNYEGGCLVNRDGSGALCRFEAADL
jgi:hypothetical protein